ncbi:hypothetical protein J6W32_02950 [bacterium]|nr:hypothetical protein [bacterium]
MHSNQIVQTKYKFYNQVFRGFPIILDEYSTAQARESAYKQKETDAKTRIWEIKPIIKHQVQSKQDNK